MKNISPIMILCAMTFGLLACQGGGGGAGKAQMMVDGEVLIFEKGVEFRIDVNPTDNPNLVRTVKPGNPQSIRYILRSKDFPKHYNGQGFNFGIWLKEKDMPMEALKELVGQDIECGLDNPISIFYMIERDGKKDVTCDDDEKSRFTIEKIEGDIISGTFEGAFKKKGPDGYVPVTVENGSFEAPITKMYKLE